MRSDRGLPTGLAGDHARLATIPNALSLIRLLLGLAVPWLPGSWRLGMVAVAALTDFLDGLTARWLHAESPLGRSLDPLADKVFILSLFATLVYEGLLAPFWAIAVIVRDLVVLIGVGWSVPGRSRLSLQNLKASPLGKWTTAAQFALLLELVTLGEPWPWLVGLTATLSVLAGIDYARRARSRQ